MTQRWLIAVKKTCERKCEIYACNLRPYLQKIILSNIVFGVEEVGGGGGVEGWWRGGGGVVEGEVEGYPLN